MKRKLTIEYDDNDLMFYSDKLADKHHSIYGNCIVVNINTVNYIADPSSTIIRHELPNRQEGELMSS